MFLKNLFAKRFALPDIDKTGAVVFILVALVFKVFFFVASMNGNGVTFSKMYFLRGDAIQYVNFCENFYQHGQHFVMFDGYKDFTYRMPNFIFIYYPVRLFLSQQNTLNFIIVFQILLSAVSTYCLALLARLAFKRDIYFYVVFIFYCLSSYLPAWNNFLWTESLGTSLFIISVYFLFIGKRDSSVKWLLLSGLLMAFSIFFRAFLGAIWAAALVYIWLSSGTIVQRIKLVAAYALCFVVMESIWIGRNFQKSGTLVLLDSSHFWYDRLAYQSERKYVDFIKAFGFSFIDWDKNFQGTWFLTDIQAKIKGTERPNDEIFPARTFNGDLTIDSLKYARTNFICAYDTTATTETRNCCDAEACRLFTKFTITQKKERPFDYYIGNRLRVLFRLLNQYSGAQLKSLKYPFNVLMVFADAFINYFAIIGGIIGLFILFFSRNKSPEIHFILFIPIFIILLFGLILLEGEARYLVTAYPFLVIICSAAIIKLIEKKQFIPLLLFCAGLLVLSANAVLNEIKF